MCVSICKLCFTCKTILKDINNNHKHFQNYIFNIYIHNYFPTEIYLCAVDKNYITPKKNTDSMISFEIIIGRTKEIAMEEHLIMYNFSRSESPASRRPGYHNSTKTRGTVTPTLPLTTVWQDTSLFSPFFPPPLMDR